MILPTFEYTNQQKEAIECDSFKRMQIMGGPGTGKTLVLKQIYKRLVSAHCCQEILVLLFNGQAITDFTGSSTAIPTPNYHIYTIRQFWFKILSKYLHEVKNIHLIELSSIDLRFLNSKYSPGSANQSIYLSQQPSILYLTSLKIIQMCQKHIKQNDSVFKKYIPNYKFLIFDEFQDIDNISFNILLDFYKQNNLIIAGDDNQSIFSWTKITKINSMQKIVQKFTDFKVFYFNQSFRCTENILLTGTTLLKPIKDPAQKRPVTRNKYNRTLYFKKYQNSKKQSDNIVKQIKLLKKQKNVGYNEIGILCRRRKLQNNIVRAMKRHGVPIFGQNLQNDQQIVIILCMMRLYLFENDFLALNIIQQYLKTSELSVTVQNVKEFIIHTKQQTNLLDLTSSIAALFKLGTNRYTYNQFTEFLTSFRPQQSLTTILKHLVRQTEILPSNKAVSVISSLSIKGLQFKYVFIPGFNYYNYRYSSQTQQSNVRKLLYTTISRSSDYVCISYFNVMNPLGLEFTKLTKKVMDLELHLDEENPKI